MTDNPFNLEQKTVIVTGASSGIGRATAIAVSQMGARVIITGRDETRLSDALASLKGDGHRSVRIDFLDDDAIDVLVGSLDGPVNGIVHAAGLLQNSLPFRFSTQAQLRKIMMVNFEAPFLLSQRLVKGKLLAPASSVVFVSSLAGIGTVYPGISMYSASKGALNASMKVMALELAKTRIRVNCVAPGMVRTNLLSENSFVTEEDLKKDEMNNYPLGYGEPIDVAHGIVYLLSDASRWITGTTLVMDGGATIH